MRTVNHLIDNDVKLLLIKDSYALPVAAFLSTCIKTVDMVDLRDTPKADLSIILKNNQYDLVITMYNTEVFDDNMFPEQLTKLGD